MKICRFETCRLGIVENDVIKDVTHVLECLPVLRWPLAAGDQVIANWKELLAPLRAAATDPFVRTLPVAATKLDSPVANPSRIIAAPLNYKLHVDESANPAINRPQGGTRLLARQRAHQRQHRPAQANGRSKLGTLCCEAA